MGMEITIYGINKSNQRSLEWYIKNKRYQNERHHLFELELYKPRELYEVLSKKSIKYVDMNEFQVISNSDLNDLMISELREDNFNDDLTKYYKLMVELSTNKEYIDNDKHDFYLIIDTSF